MHTTSLPVVGKPIYKLFSVASSDFSLFLGCPGPHLLPKPSQQPQPLPQPVPMKDHGSPSVSSLSSESPPVLASKSKSSSSKQSSSTSNRYHPSIPNHLNASLGHRWVVGHISDHGDSRGSSRDSRHVGGGKSKRQEDQGVGEDDGVIFFRHCEVLW